MSTASKDCCLCGVSTEAAVEEREVHSNVRAFRQRAFSVWRCPACRSIHARDFVELDPYYAGYPFFWLPVDWRLRIAYDNQLGRLRRASLEPGHRILDYGCGGGHFVKHLELRGYPNSFGYDDYASAFADRSLLEGRYDCVITQDVLEHVPDPAEFLDTLDLLVQPGGLIAIGTPNADAIDLGRAESYAHALHAPYHRHILSKQALLEAGKRRAWTVEHYYPVQYANTRVPFLNSRFYLYYMRLMDDTLDCLLEPPRAAPLLTRLPLTLFWAFFGSFFAEETDVMAIFRKPR